MAEGHDEALILGLTSCGATAGDLQEVTFEQSPER